MEATIARPPAELRVDEARWSPAEESEQRTRVDALRWIVCLAAAGVCPLLATHPLLPRARWVASWELLGASWGSTALFLVPLAGAGLAFLSRKRRRYKTRCLWLAATGLGSLWVVSCVPFDERILVYRLGVLLAPTSAKLALLAVGVLGAFAAGGNYLRRQFPYSTLGRGLPLVAAMGMLTATCWASFGETTILGTLFSPNDWQSNWPSLILAILGLAYCATAAANALPHRYAQQLSQLLSLLARVALVWAPVAFYLERQGAGQLGYLLPGADTRTPDLVATAKLTATLYGALFLLSTGVAGWLVKHEWDYIVRCESTATLTGSPVCRPNERHSRKRSPVGPAKPLLRC